MKLITLYVRRLAVCKPVHGIHWHRDRCFDSKSVCRYTHLPGQGTADDGAAHTHHKPPEKAAGRKRLKLQTK